jgi:hypothetical protein
MTDVPEASLAAGREPPPDALAMLDRLDAFLGRYVVFPSDHARQATTLWTAHTHTLAAFDSTPRLALLSPEKGSGKTRALEAIETVVPEPVFTVNVSPAALFRLVGARQPTLLLDEADTYLGPRAVKNHEDLRGLINAGHRRGAKAYRGEVSGKSVDIVEFPAFAACALAGIGDLPDTVLDRAVVIPMRRRAPHEYVEPFRIRQVRQPAAKLKAELARWAVGVVGELATVEPDMPTGIVDRAADVWEPLVAIADVVGGHWPERARRAAEELEKVKVERAPSLGVRLLADCRTVFCEVWPVDRIESVVLVEMLTKREEWPWGDLKGKPLDAAGLARLLRRYGVRPTTHRFGPTTAKGYLADDFSDGWLRYLPPDDACDPYGRYGVTGVTAFYGERETNRDEGRS